MTDSMLSFGLLLQLFLPILGLNFALPDSMSSPAVSQKHIRIIGGFEGPYGLRVLPDGQLLVADAVAGKIIRVAGDPAGWTWLGLRDGDPDGWHVGGIATKGSVIGALDFPHAIEIDDDGTLLVSDHRAGRISRYAPDGKYLGLAFGSHDSGAMVQGPVHVHVSRDGRAWVTDYVSHRLLLFANNGAFSGWRGARADGTIVTNVTKSGTAIASALPGGFSRPHMVTVDRTGAYYVADTGNHRIQKFAPDGALIGWIGARSDGSLTDGWTLAGESAAGAKLGAFFHPTAITLAEGDSVADDVLIVSDVDNHRVVRVALDGKATGWIGGFASGGVTDGWSLSGTAGIGSEPGAFNNPYYAEVHQEELFVVDTGNKRVQVIPLR